MLHTETTETTSIGADCQPVSAAHSLGVSIAQLTPMLRQYFELKEQLNDAILFCRMGDFYEIFGKDAEEIAPKLDIVLTSRERGDESKIPFCGVPHHSAKGYWLKLLSLGYKVALAEQMEDPSEAKGLVRREITKVMTPGCIDDIEGLEHSIPNFFMAFYESPDPSHSNQWSVAVVDVSTGEFRLGNCHSSELLNTVYQFKPREILCRRFCLEMLQKDYFQPFVALNLVRFDTLPEAPLRDKEAQKKILSDIFGQARAPGPSRPSRSSTKSAEANPASFVDTIAGGIELVASVVNHLQTMRQSCKQFLTIRPLQDPDTMSLGETAIRDLELFETARRRTSEGSLIRVIDKTLTPMGARLLRHSLANPLIDRDAILLRHDAIETLCAHSDSSLGTIRSELREVADLARLATRLAAGSIHPAELGAIKKTLQVTEKVEAILRAMLDSEKSKSKAKQVTSELILEIGRRLLNVERPRLILNGALCDAPNQLGALGSGSGVFKSGFDSLLDERMNLARNGEAKVAAYEATLRERTGISSLKIKSHKTFGLLIEVTKSNLQKVPSDFIRRQTMVNCERFATVELRELGEALEQASDLAVQRESELYQTLLLDLAVFRHELSELASTLAYLDVLQGFAWLSIQEQYVRPVLHKGGSLRLLGSRHPVVEFFVGKTAFVPNHIEIDENNRHLLITGPNMAGKSTVMRQTAISAILAQAGGFVPAEEAEMPIFDRIYTRVGASDDLSRGYSTFMVEMAEAAEILRNATARSLVILDEVGRGTSTSDGLAIASAIFHELSHRVGCFSLFATHYHELVPLARNFPQVKLVQTEVKDNDGRIKFTHRLIDGACRSSFGIEVARLAGLPNSVVSLAEDYLGKQLSHEAAVSQASKAVEGKVASKESPAPQMLPQVKVSDAGLLDPRAAEAIERLERLKIHRTTPLQALNFINDIKELLHRPRQGELFEDHPC